MPRDLRSLTRDELTSQLKSWGEPAYRVDQVLQWAYPQAAADWKVMTNLSCALRDRLAQTYALRLPELVRVQGSRDSTRKFLWRLADGALIESVLIPASPALYGEVSDRHTLCLSTQVGCAYGCKFCASGLDGFKRNLAVEEMVGQVLAIERWDRQEENRVPAEARAPEGAAREPGGRRVRNLVIMGMGEPLANYENLLKALQILNAPWGGGIGARKITVSTSGLVPRIRSLANQPLQFGLAISLHGATDEVRNRLMPVNRKYPLRELIPACESYVAQQGRMITFEYILIAGVNDGLDQVRPLAQLARLLHAKVNLIPYNNVEGLSWARPPESRQEAFRSGLEAQRVAVTLRREKGHDIDAACGQLRLKEERTTPGAETRHSKRTQSSPRVGSQGHGAGRRSASADTTSERSKA